MSVMSDLYLVIFFCFGVLTGCVCDRHDICLSCQTLYMFFMSDFCISLLLPTFHSIIPRPSALLLPPPSSLSCRVLSCLVVSCLVLSCLVLSCLVLSCLVLSCLVLSGLVLSGLVLSFVVVSCLVLLCLA